MAAQQDDNRPGGGLGVPIDSPDALAKYRWPLLIALLVVLFGVAYLALSRTAPHTPVTTEGVSVPLPPEVARAAATPKASGSSAVPPTVTSKSGNALLDAMKEELFQLEVERQQGQISVEEYETQKAALDQTLKRALARSQRNS
jgi:hypothetical protein